MSKSADESTAIREDLICDKENFFLPNTEEHL